MSIDLIKALEQGSVVDEHAMYYPELPSSCICCIAPLAAFKNGRLKPERLLSKNIFARK